MLLLAVVVTVLLASHCSAVSETQIYVSPKGNDNNNGTNEFPFKTIQQAQVRLRLSLELCRQQECADFYNNDHHKMIHVFIYS
jgi:hypothetical protein